MLEIKTKILVSFRTSSSELFWAFTTILVFLAGTVCASVPLKKSDKSQLIIWQDTPVNPNLVSQKNVGNKVDKDNQKIQWDVWGLPIGNGRLGAVFYGNVEKELVQFNENSLWSGGDTNISVTKAGAKRPENGNYGSYQPFGDLLISFPHSKFTDYRRELDISRAVGTVTYKSGGVTYHREYFASYPDQVLVVRLSADKPGSISGSVKLADRHLAKITAEENTITARGKLDEKLYISYKFTEVAFGTPEQIANAPHTFAGNNMKYEAMVRVINDGGTIKGGADGELKMSNANSVTILLAAGTDYLADASKNWRGEDPDARVNQQIDAASKRTYEELLSRHMADYQSLFNRVRLDLGKTDPRKTALPMDKRLEDYRKIPNDPELVTLMADFGRYLLISCSRPGSLPANLQGLWNPERIWAAWSADYHLNVNLEMNYWQTGAGNLSECDEPLIYWLQSVMPVLTHQTKAEFGTRGWAAGWGLNLFGGGSIGKKIEGAWLCMHLYENYKFTHNRKLMEEVSFPIIRGAVNFWEDNLIEKDGVLLAPMVQSPEWGPTEDGVLYAQELIWELFTDYIEFADILGVDKIHRDKIAAMRDKLATPKIGKHGDVMEWQTEYPQMWGKGHRHSSHLVGLYPGRQIAPLTTPELAKAAVVTLVDRGDGSTGWSKIHKAAMWARLYYGNEAMNLVKAFIQTHIWPSALSSINASDKFQIDANLGLPAVIYEMFLQSQTGVIDLLPALPSDFPKGAVYSIRGRGGFLIDLTWDKGELTQAVVHSTLGEPCKVRYRNKIITLNIKNDEKVILDKDLRIMK